MVPISPRIKRWVLGIVIVVGLILLSFFTWQAFFKKPTSSEIIHLIPSKSSFSWLRPAPLRRLIERHFNLIVKQENDPRLKILKDVGEPYLDHFSLKDTDFERIAEAGFEIIESNFDICASDEDVSYFLDQSQQAGLQVILSAGAGEAEWGYECDQEVPDSQRPEWRPEKVTEWIKKWQDHPALYAWDISNEAGGNFPNGGQRWFWLTLEQLQRAYQDVSAADPDHPIMIRMNGWFFYDSEDDFFTSENPFGEGVADIVMVNAYSNVEDYYSDFVTTVVGRAQGALLAIDPHLELVVALGVWEESPLWHAPSLEELRSDYNQLGDFEDILGVAFFKYGAEGSEWYLPSAKGGQPDLWQELSRF